MTSLYCFEDLGTTPRYALGYAQLLPIFAILYIFQLKGTVEPPIVDHYNAHCTLVEDGSVQLKDQMKDSVQMKKLDDVETAM